MSAPRVMVTGAAGRIGREMIDELRDAYELCLVDRRRIDQAASVTADLSRTQWRVRRPHRLRRIKGPLPRWEKALRGVSAVLHLAAEPSPGASWAEVARHNIQATGNLMDAVKRHQVEKVVFASSHRVMLGLVHERAPDCYRPDGPKITSDDLPRPISPYGISKIAGELIGRVAVERHGLRSFVAVRIGSFRPEPSLHDDTRHTWVSPRDLRRLLRRCLEADLPGFHVVYGISAQASSPYDLRPTHELFGWAPTDAS